MISTQRQMHQSKKGQCINLALAIYYRDTNQRVHSKMRHLGMRAEQTRSVKLGIESHADYMYS